MGTIAHRLNTVLDSDRVLVLEAGRVKEIGAPDQLLADSNSALHSLAAHAGISRHLQAQQEAQENGKLSSEESSVTNQSGRERRADLFV